MLKKVKSNLGFHTLDSLIDDTVVAEKNMKRELKAMVRRKGK
jgi:hypothetical protein